MDLQLAVRAVVAAMLTDSIGFTFDTAWPSTECITVSQKYLSYAR